MGAEADFKIEYNRRLSRAGWRSGAEHEADTPGNLSAEGSTADFATPSRKRRMPFKEAPARETGFSPTFSERRNAADDLHASSKRKSVAKPLSSPHSSRGLDHGASSLNPKTASSNSTPRSEGRDERIVSKITADQYTFDESRLPPMQRTMKRMLDHGFVKKPLHIREFIKSGQSPEVRTIKLVESMFSLAQATGPNTVGGIFRTRKER